MRKVSIERLRRAIWTLKQPLTRRPSQNGAPISDLFVWRNSAEWRTSFELMDVTSLFSDGPSGAGHADFIFFNRDGQQILTKRIDLSPNRRCTLDISAMLGADYGNMGTFSIFHSSTPEVVTNAGSFLAERGYVSYRYCDAPLQAYVHGNLDAVTLSAGAVQRLGGTSILPRSYHLQYLMDGPALYELAIVNPTDVDQWCTCEVLGTIDSTIQESQKVKIAPGTSHLFAFQCDEASQYRAVIKSRLVMARPLVFRTNNFKLDVFHG